MAAHNGHRSAPAPDPFLSTLRRLCHSYSVGLPIQCLIKLQVQDQLCIRTRIAHQPIMPGFRCQVCRLVKF